MFATDRDLLVFEPRLFNELGFGAQRVADAAGAGSLDASGSTLTLTGGRFNDWGVSTGWVVLVNDAPLEVVTRFNQTQLYVSRLREDTTQAVIPAAQGAGLNVRVSTFRPQIALIHDMLLRSLGIEPGAAAAPGVLTDSAVTNPRALVRAECLGTLHLLFAASAPIAGESSIAWAKARSYAERFDQERRRLRAEIDTTGDGSPDALRRPNVERLFRA